MAVLHTTPTPLHDLEQGQSLCQQSLTLARQIDDQPAEAKALWNIMNIHKFKEEFQQAITVGNQGLDIARRLNLRQQMAYILNDISWIYINAGQMDTALQSSAEARALWKELNNLPMLADNLTGGATYNLISGQLATSMDEANQSLEVSRKINNIWNISQSGWIKGLIHLIWGEFEKAIDTLEGIISLESTNSFANPQVNARADLGLIYGTLGHIEQGIAFCLEAQENVSSEMFQNWQSYPSAILAQLYVLKGDFKAANQAIDACRPKLNESGITPAVVWLATAEAELAIKFKNYDQALEIANQLNAQLRQMGLNVFLDLGLYLKGQALLAQNRNAEAREALQEALQLAQAQTARYILWHIQIELYKLEQQAGNPADAQHMHQQARQTIEYIVDHAPLHLRASFLARPKIRQIMDNV